MERCWVPLLDNSGQKLDRRRQPPEIPRVGSRLGSGCRREIPAPATLVVQIIRLVPRLRGRLATLCGGSPRQMKSRLLQAPDFSRIGQLSDFETDGRAA